MLDRVTGGVPLTLITDGRLNRRAMARERINEEELWSLLRQEGVEALEEVQRATLELDGRLSVIKTRDARELQTGDAKRMLTNSPA